MKRTAFAFSLLLALGLGFVPTAEARDVEITVPVRIASLHPTITVGRVQCMAMNSGGTSMVGSAGRSDFTLTSGSYSGDVTVRLTLTEAMLRQAGMWRCELRFYRPFEGSGQAFSLEGGASFREEFRLAPDSERRFQVQGTL